MFREGDGFDNPEVLAHIKECGGCSRSYERWCSIAAALGSVPDHEAPPALYGKVITKIDTLEDRRKRWAWIPSWQGYPLPAAAFLIVVLLTAGAFFLARWQRTVRPSQKTVSVEAGAGQVEEMAHFEITLADARQVSLVGDFNGWDTARHQLKKGSKGVWSIDLPIKRGCYQYLFYVDGKSWTVDPAAKQTVPDGFGGFNMVVEI
jgi:1,4-alpha-glucan branching enzyme